MDDRQPLSSSQWSQVQELFQRALELTGDERVRFVGEACGDDAALRRELTSLLRSHEASGVLDGPVPMASTDESAEQLAVISEALTGRYEVARELGRGGMATVYLARDVRHGRQVAVKVLWPGVGALVGKEHFLREIEISARLRHPHILPLFDSGGDGGLLFFVMPYVEGETLRERIDREGRLPVHEALGFGREVAEALGHAHARGVVHRDIKPGNLFLEAGHVVVADFGIGKAFEHAGDPHLTRTGLTLGTPLYMSPEQVSGERAVDGRSDVYSLGCVLFESLTGMPPFTGDSVASLIRQHLFEEPPIAAGTRPSLPAWIDEILTRAMAKRPEDRFQTAEELAEAIGERRSWRTLEGGASSASVGAVGPTRRLTTIFSADVQGYSRLMNQDEAGTIRALGECRRLIFKHVAAHGGRVVDSPGDNVLAEFTSVVHAVQAGVEVQGALKRRNDARPETSRMEFRVGINIGDVVVEGEKLYGAGVNLAARLEVLAEGGGICVSSDVVHQVEGKLPVEFDDLGEHRVKNFTRPVRVYRVRTDGEQAPGIGSGTVTGSEERKQEIRFCQAPDGVRLGYAVSGGGPPLVKAANWLNHLEYDWSSPVWRHLLRALTSDHQLIRYDERGNGLSDWDVDDISFDAFVRDLEAVVDAAGVERFTLLGVSQGCSVSIAYAVRHPERVTKLVLYGGYARGRYKRGSQGEVEQAEAIVTLMRQGWGQENPAFRQIFTARFVPEATPEQAKWFDELQRTTTSPENAARLRVATNEIDVTHLLQQVNVPTLVLHCRGDAAVPFEEGRLMAAGIPDARFVALEGRNHLILEDEPAWPRFLEEVRSFLR